MFWTVLDYWIFIVCSKFYSFISDEFGFMIGGVSIYVFLYLFITVCIHMYSGPFCFFQTQDGRSQVFPQYFVSRTCSGLVSYDRIPGIPHPLCSVFIHHVEKVPRDPWRSGPKYLSPVYVELQVEDVTIQKLCRQKHHRRHRAVHG